MNMSSLSRCVDELRNGCLGHLREVTKCFKDRGALASGVAVYCSEDDSCVRRMDLERDGLEVL